MSIIKPKSRTTLAIIFKNLYNKLELQEVSVVYNTKTKIIPYK